MKKISTLIGFIAIGGMLFAQSPIKQNSGMDFVELSANSSPEITNHVTPSKQVQRGPGDVIYLFDFNSGLPTGWSNSGNPSGALWEYRGPSTTPSNAVGSQGAYNGGRGPIQSSSASNGFMIFDSDYLDNGGTPGAFGTGTGPAPHTGEMITGTLDFSSYPNVTMTCESYTRMFAGACWVRFSYDNGATYADTVLLHDDLGANDESADPEMYSFNVSQYVGGKNNVVISFMFDGTNPLGFNTTGDGYYFWQLDDIAFIETPAYDINIADWAVSHGAKLGVHGYTPLAEATSVNYTAIIQNLGSATATGVSLDVDVMHPSGTTSYGASGGSLMAGSDTIVETTGGITATDTGWYQVTVTANMDSADFDPNNNNAYNDFTITDSIYGLDNGIITAYMGTNSFTGGEDGFQMLNIYEFANSYDLGAVWVRLSSLTRPGAQVYVVAYDSTGTTFGGGGQFANQTSPNYKSEAYTISVADSIKGYAIIPTSFTIPAGGYYVGLEMYSTGGVYTCRIALDESVPQDPYASLIYLLNTGLYTNPEACFIRLGPSVGSLSDPNDPCIGSSITVTGTVDDTVSVQPYGKITNVTANGGVAPYVYTWSGPSGYTSNLANIEDILIQGDYTVTATDADGCTGSNTFTVAGNVSTNDIAGAEMVSIYPNPSNGNLNINMNNVNGEYLVKVKNVLGQTVYNDLFVANSNLATEIDLNNVEKGVYFISISGGSFEYTEKVIIK